MSGDRPDARAPHWDASERAWRITRYRDAAFLLKSDDVAIVEASAELAKLSARGGGAFPNLILLLGTSHPFQNGQAHDASRAMLKGMMAGLQRRWTAERIGSATAALLAEAGTEFDAVAGLAKRLPEIIVADALAMAESDVRRCAVLTRRVTEIWHRNALPLRELRTLEAQAAELTAALTGLFGEERRADFARLALVTMAGTDTTAGLIASALHMLVTQPALQQWLRDAPAGISGFVDEVLRYRPPLRRLLGRRTMKEVMLSDAVLPAGAFLIIDIESANFDAALFAKPQEFDPARAGPPPLSFGAGAHACVGAALARMEAKVAIEQLVGDFVIHPAGDAVRGANPDWYDFKRLPIRLERRGTLAKPAPLA